MIFRLRLKCEKNRICFHFGQFSLFRLIGFNGTHIICSFLPFIFACHTVLATHYKSHRRHFTFNFPYQSIPISVSSLFLDNICSYLEQIQLIPFGDSSLRCVKRTGKRKKLNRTQEKNYCMNLTNYQPNFHISQIFHGFS